MTTLVVTYVTYFAFNSFIYFSQEYIWVKLIWTAVWNMPNRNVLERKNGRFPRELSSPIPKIMVMCIACYILMFYKIICLLIISFFNTNLLLFFKTKNTHNNCKSHCVGFYGISLSDVLYSEYFEKYATDNWRLNIHEKCKKESLDLISIE